MLRVISRIFIPRHWVEPSLPSGACTSRIALWCRPAAHTHCFRFPDVAINPDFAAPHLFKCAALPICYSTECT